jgi:predicted amidohydrolase YtcJ
MKSYSSQALALGVCLALAACTGREAPPEIAVVHANVITVGSSTLRAEAFLVRDGRFVAVGSNAEIQSRVGRETEVLDLEGKTVTPGFIDAHLHPIPIFPENSRMSYVELGPRLIRTIDELIDALREKAERTPPDEWVFGFGYQDTKLGRHPTREDLDRVSTEHPIMIFHSSGHIRVFNSRVLAQANITHETSDPPGGAFDRDETGVPNGVCREAAVDVVLERAPDLPDPGPLEAAEGMKRAFERYAEKGITSVGDALVDPAKLVLYKFIVGRSIPVRVYAMAGDEHFRWLRRLGLRTGSGNEHLRIGAVKVFHGNSLSGRTAWLYEPYADRPDYYGVPPDRSQEELDELIFEIHAAGFQAAVHSNGDREIDMVLDAFEKALEKLPREDHRHRIEHASIVNPSILERVKKLGVVLALHSYVYEHGDKMEAYGEHRFGMMHPNRSALDLGIPVAGNSDSPVSAADPLLRIQSLVTRRSAEGKVYGPEQRITVEEAIRIFTLGAAYASFEEEIKGSIEPGKLADFVVLSADPTNVPVDEIQDIRVEKTFIGGRQVYEH